MNLLEVKDLEVRDYKHGKALVEHISFQIKPDNCLAIIGESGSGKSVSCKAIMGINPSGLLSRGSIMFKGEELINKDTRDLRKLRGKSLSMIMQNAMSAFDPSCTIGTFLYEVLQEHLGLNKKDSYRMTAGIFETLMLKDPEDIAKKYPHQLSGGMLQRVMIALSIALKPDLIIADEPTTALDSITQFELIKQMIRIRKETGISLIFISHDLGLVKTLADDIVVMKQGRIVESGSAADIFRGPKSEYAKYLVGTRMALGNKFRTIMREAV
ncbi:MAG: ABC transporter ATP-binding protein [Spirochaetaceae bacterium]|jgi:nickel transport system ATP-binding protein|nr:ABC transporter ATP-binding protein [Spirochaetaceae bacterium]